MADTPLHPDAEAWLRRGRFVGGPVGPVFVIDEPADGVPDGPPVLLLHGFPTCSYDWHRVWPQLRRTRRLIAPDLPGYGLSAKPDVPYDLEVLADAVIDVVVDAGVDEVDLVTHDMGDTVGGALLARDLEGTLPFRVRRRVLTNGSIYIRMAGLRWQQRLLLLLPDRSLPLDLPAAMYTRGLARIYGGTPPPVGELDTLWSLMQQERGNRLLPRLIRYVEQRRVHEQRWTGAIETHPAPLTIVWGDADPVAVPAMAERLLAARPDAQLRWLHGVGHFPMTESPDAFAAAVLAGITG